jgi:hypothetical protein
MQPMQTLRNARWITHLVLVWFALFIGAAVASPLVKPVGGQMVCSAMGGMKMVMDSENGNAAQPSASMDCPLCAPVITPPAPLAFAVQLPSALAHALQTLPAAHIASITGAPLPPRGPPALN